MSEPRWRYQDPDGEYEVSRSDILQLYFNWWAEQMRRVGKDDQISEEACIADWVTVHWAWKVDDSGTSGGVSHNG